MGIFSVLFPSRLILVKLEQILMEQQQGIEIVLGITAQLTEISADITKLVALAANENLSPEFAAALNAASLKAIAVNAQYEPPPVPPADPPADPTAARRAR